MSIRDLQTLFADDVSIAASAGTAVIGSVIDIGTDGINDVDDVYFVAEIGATDLITGGSAGTVQVKLTTDSNVNLTTAPVDIILSASIVTGASGNAAGKVLVNVQLPVAVYKRFLGVKVVTGTTTTTAGTIRAFLNKGISTWKAFVAGTTDTPLA